MSQQPGGQPRSDPPYGQQPPSDPYYGQSPYYGPPADGSRPPPRPEESGSRGGVGAAMVGIFLVVLGVWFLFRDEIALDFGRLWPMLAVGLGVIMVIAAFWPRRRR